MQLGWLSPGGEMIEAGYLDHIAVADDIALKYYQVDETDDLPDEFLMDHGWVHITISIFDGQYHIMWYHHLTDNQKQYLIPKIEQEWNMMSDFTKIDLEKEGINYE